MKLAAVWKRSRARGQAVVEFGLIAVSLVLVIGAGIDLGLMVATRQSVSAATGEAARQAAYGASPADVVATAQKAATGTLANPLGLAVAVRYCNASGACASYCSNFLAPDRVRPADCGVPAPSVGDWVTVTLWEEKYEVLTPIIREWAVATGDELCQHGDQACYMRLSSSETVRYPGPAPARP